MRSLIRLNLILDQLISFKEGEVHTAFVPWSDYNKGSAGRKIKKAVTDLLPPQRLTQRGTIHRGSRQTDPDTGLPLEGGDAPGFKEIKGNKKYPLYTKGQARFNVSKYLRARYETEGMPLTKRIEGLQHGIGTAGKTESDVLKEAQGLTAERRARRKGSFKEFVHEAKRQHQSELGGEGRLGAKELRDRTRKTILNEISSTRRYMAGEVGAVINPFAPPGQKFRSTGARAIIKARGVNPAIARAYPERLAEYHKRLEGLVEHHQQRASSILTHGEKHLDSWIAKGMQRSGHFPEASEAEIGHQASELRSYISHPEPTRRHSFIPSEQKDKLAQYLSLGHPKGKTVSVQDVERIKDRADATLARASTGAGARQAILKKESGKIFRAPLEKQIKGYPYLRKLGTAGKIAGIGGGLLAGGALTSKLFRRKQETRMAAKMKLHKFAFDPEVADRIMQNVSMDFFKEREKLVGRKPFPSEKRIGAMAMLRHLVDRGAIHPEAVAHLGQPKEWLKNPQLPLPGFKESEIHAHHVAQSVPTIHGKWEEAETKARITKAENQKLAHDVKVTNAAMGAEREERQPLIERSHQAGFDIGKRSGRSEGAKAANEVSANRIGRLTAEHKTALGLLRRKARWAGAGALGTGIAIGSLAGARRKSKESQFRSPRPLIQFREGIDWDRMTREKEQQPPEITGEDPQWLKTAAHKTLYGRGYSTRGQAANLKKWGGRTHRLIRDITNRAKGTPSLDARGRPRKNEWERPWVTGALITGGLVGGIYGLKKAAGIVRHAPLESKLGQLKEGFLRADYSKKVPGLQKVGQFYHGVKEDMRRLVYRPAKKPKYDFSIVNPETGSLKTQDQLARERSNADHLSSLRKIAEGKKKHPDATFASRISLIHLAEKTQDRPLTRKQKEKLLLEGGGAVGALALILARRKGGGFPSGGIHIHNYPGGGASVPVHAPPRPVFFSAIDKLHDKLKAKDSTAGHDVSVGSIEGGLGVLATDPLIRRVIQPKTLAGKFAIGAGVGGLATGAVGYGLSGLLRAKRAAMQQRQDTQMNNRTRLHQFKIVRSHDRVLHDGTRIDILALNRLVQDRAANRIKIKSLKPMAYTKKSGYSERRVARANIQKPILIHRGEVIDGRHRITRKQRLGHTIASAIKVTSKDLNSVKMNDRTRSIQFRDNRTIVARDRYGKQIRSEDLLNAHLNYIHSAGAGAGIAALLRKPGSNLSRTLLKGAGLGLGAQAATRAATSTTKDQFGDRSITGKRLDKAPWIAGTAAGGFIAAKKLRLGKLLLSARTRAIHFGVRTLRTGQIAKWGRHLDRNLPEGTLGKDIRGTYSIEDPQTKARMVVERSSKPFGEGKSKWWKHKQAYIAHLDLPEKFRPQGNKITPEAIQGGKSLQKLHSIIPEHFDKRGITASVNASNYEQGTLGGRAQQTLGLINRYQKRGFKLNSASLTPDEWVAPMIRKPGAKRIKPITGSKYNRYTERLRNDNAKNARSELREELRPIAKHLTVTGAAGGGLTATAIAAHKKNKKAQTILPAAGVTAGILGAIHSPKLARAANLPHLASIYSNLGTILDAKKLQLAKRLINPTSHGGKFLSRQIARII